MEYTPELEAELRTLVDTHPIIHLATIDADGTPRVTTLLCFVDENWNFYFTTHGDTAKYMNILSNKNVAWDLGGFNDSYNLQCKGVAEVVDDPEAEEALVSMLTKNIANLEGFWPPVAQVKDTHYVFVKLKPTWARALKLSKNISREGDSYFELPLK